MTATFDQTAALEDPEGVDYGKAREMGLDVPAAPAPIAAPSPADTMPDPLARLRARTEIKRPTIDLPVRVPNSEEDTGFTVRYRINIPQPELRKLIKDSRLTKAPDADIDVLKYNSLICGHYCTGLLLDGQLLTDVDGDPLTFQSRESLQAADGTVRGAVRYLLRHDANVIQHGGAVLRAAGYDDNAIEAADPS